MIPDAGNAVGNGEITASTWPSNQHSAILVEQHWSCRTVIWIVDSNHNARQAAALIECVILDAGDAVGDGDARQAGAVIEYLRPDAGDVVGNGDARQAAAATECAIPEQFNAVGNDDAYQAAAAIECDSPDAGDAAPVNNSWNLNRPSGGSRIVSNRHRRIVGIDLVSIQARYCSPRIA